MKLMLLKVNPLLLNISLALLAVGFGCSEDKGKTTSGDAASRDSSAFDQRLGEAPLKEPMSFFTFNAGLVRGYVPYAQERAPLIIDALKKVTTDVLCIEEAWLDEDSDALINGLKAVFPYSFREKTEDTATPSLKCEDGDTVLKLYSCVVDKCKTVSITECVQNQCKDLFNSLPPICQFCLASNTSNPAICIEYTKDFSNSGRNGLILFSRLPMQDAKYTAMETILLKRGVITATIGTRQIQCTHLPSNLPVVPYVGTKFKSWPEEHAAAIGSLIKTASAKGCTVLMGDLNSGLTKGEIVGELEDNFKALPAAGYQEPWDNHLLR